ncbi:MAG TPA: SDR family oxidoreductase [Acidobacteriota bacterium]|jgi:UDP-glucose 4-epimerase
MPVQVVTGGAGFIGSHIVERLLRDGEDVVLVDDFSTGHEENITDFQSHPRLRIERISILQKETLGEILKGAQFVFHQAAIPSVQKSVQHPLETNQVNITGTLNVLMAARQAGVKRVVYAASSSVYGDTEALPKSEEFLPQPMSPYALQKYVGEIYGQLFFKLYGIETIALRYFNVFGPRQDPTSEYSAVIPRFVTAMLKGEAPVIYGDGEQSRDFTYIDNVVEANMKAAHAPPAAGQVMNIGVGDRISLNQIVKTLNEVLGTRIDPRYDSARPGDVKHSQASIERARHLIGYKPLVDFKTGLKRTVEWYSRRRN